MGGRSPFTPLHALEFDSVLLSYFNQNLYDLINLELCLFSFWSGGSFWAQESPREISDKMAFSSETDCSLFMIFNHVVVTRGSLEEGSRGVTSPLDFYPPLRLLPFLGGGKTHSGGGGLKIARNDTSLVIF